MAENGAALLRQSRHVEYGAALAFHMGGHAEQGPDGNHTRTANSGYEDAVWLGDRRQARLGERAEAVAARNHALVLAQPGAMYRHEAGAETVGAGKVLVAGRLIGGALAVGLTFDRDGRYAGRF